MEGLIKQAFRHVNVIDKHVHEGYYDLIGTSGEIILPQVWESIIEPGMTINMHMWSINESKTVHSTSGQSYPDISLEKSNFPNDDEITVSSATQPSTQLSEQQSFTTSKDSPQPET